MDAALLLGGKRTSAPRPVGAEEFKVSFKSAAGVAKDAGSLSTAVMGPQVASSPAVMQPAGVAVAAPVSAPLVSPVASAPAEAVGETVPQSTVEIPQVGTATGGEPLAARRLEARSPGPLGHPVFDPEELPAEASPGPLADLPGVVAVIQPEPSKQTGPVSDGMVATPIAVVAPPFVAVAPAVETGLVMEGAGVLKPSVLVSPRPFMQDVPDKKMGKGPLAPVAINAASPVETVGSVQLITSDLAVPVAVVASPPAPAVSAAKVVAATAVQGSPKVQGATPKKAPPIAVAVPATADPVEHRMVSEAKPVVHAEPVPVTPQKADAPLIAGVPTLAPVVSATPLLTGSATIKVDATPVLAPSTPVTAEPLQATQPGDVRTLASTPQTLEVGVATGTHGWLRVRAEMGSAGEVVASVVASSPVTAEALHRGLPALHEYLAHEQMGLVSVEIASPRVPVPSPDQGIAAGVESQAGAREQQAQQGQQAAAGTSADDAQPWLGEELSTSSEMPFLQSPGRGGGWLSVRV